MKRRGQKTTDQGFQGRAGSSGNARFRNDPGGNCLCPKCNYTEAHSPGMPCRDKECPQCGTRMIRE